jgi:hypothetical protein
VARAVQLIFRSIRFAAVAVLATACGGGVQSTAPVALQCSGSFGAADARTVGELRSTLEAASFYRSLVERFGAPSACGIEMQGGRFSLRYPFPKGAELRGTFQPAGGYADHAVHTQTALSRQQALEHLKLAERDQFGERGCGIGWSKPAEQSATAGGAERLAYRGDTCNCQGYLELKGTRIETFGFRSAC